MVCLCVWCMYAMAQWGRSEDSPQESVLSFLWLPELKLRLSVLMASTYTPGTVPTARLPRHY